MSFYFYSNRSRCTSFDLLFWLCQEATELKKVSQKSKVEEKTESVDKQTEKSESSSRRFSRNELELKKDVKRGDLIINDIIQTMSFDVNRTSGPVTP